MEIVRPEQEATYLRHQVRCLRSAHQGELQVVYDTLPGQEPYDRVRVRLQGDELHPAYDLLCPYDEKRISVDILGMTGLEGLVSLWADRGRRQPTAAGLLLGRRWPSSAIVASWTQDLGCPADVRMTGAGNLALHWGRQEAQELMKLLRPLLHPSRRITTWPRQGRQWVQQSAEP